MMDVYRKIGLLMAEAAKKTEGPVQATQTAGGSTPEEVESMRTERGLPARPVARANEKLRKARAAAEAEKQADASRRGTTPVQGIQTSPGDDSMVRHRRKSAKRV